MRILHLFLSLILLTTTCFGQNLKPVRGMPFVNRGHKLSKGLVGLWLLNEGSGNKVFDLSGNGNIGTITNALWVPGKFGSALAFDGDGDYVDCGSIGYIPSEFSIVLQAKRRTVVPANNMIVGTGGGGNNYAGLVVYENGNVHQTIAAGGTRSMWNGVWTDKSDYHHLAFVTDKVGADSGHRLYFDGVNRGEKSDEVSSFTAFRIAEMVQLTTRAFDGIIDYVMIYNRALSASEIALLYREPFCMFGRDDIAIMAKAAEVPPAGGAQVILISQVGIILFIPALILIKRKSLYRVN